MCECDKMLKEIVRMPERTQRSGSKCLCGAFASPLMKMLACPNSRLPLRLHLTPLEDLAKQTRGFPEGKRGTASLLGYESRAPPTPVSSRSQEPWSGGRSGAAHPAACNMTNTSPKGRSRKQLYKALVDANKALCRALTSPLLWQPVHFKEQNVGD